MTSSLPNLPQPRTAPEGRRGRSPWLGLALTALLAAGTPISAWAQVPMSGPTAAQPRLPTQVLTIISQSGARHSLTTEIAATEAQREIGMMFRDHIADGEAMLFDFGTVAPQSMWMRNTRVSLDMLFVGDDGRIIHLAERAVPYSLANIDSGGPIRAVIEVAGGLAERWDIEVGDRIEGGIFPKPQ